MQHHGTITADKDTIMKLLDQPVKINVDVNTDDSLTIIKPTDIEIGQDIRIIIEETQPPTCHWIRTGFQFIDNRDNLTDLQIEVINLGIREANNKLRYPMMHDGRIYVQDLKDIRTI